MVASLNSLPMKLHDRHEHGHSQLEEQRHYYEQKVAVLHQKHTVEIENDRKQVFVAFV